MNRFVKHKTSKKNTVQKKQRVLREDLHAIPVKKEDKTGQEKADIKLPESPIEENKNKESHLDDKVLTVDELLLQIKTFKEEAEKASLELSQLKEQQEKELEKVLAEKDLEVEAILSNIQSKELELKESTLLEKEKIEAEILEQKRLQSDEISQLCTNAFELIESKDKESFETAKDKLNELEAAVVKNCLELNENLKLTQSQLNQTLDNQYRTLEQEIEKIKDQIRDRRKLESDTIERDLETWKDFLDIVYKEKTDQLKIEIDKLSSTQIRERNVLLENVDNVKNDITTQLNKDLDSFYQKHEEGIQTLEDAAAATKLLMEDTMNHFNDQVEQLNSDFKAFAESKDSELKVKIGEAKLIIEASIESFNAFITESDERLSFIKSNYTSTMAELMSQTDEFINTTSKTLNKEIEVKEATLNALILSIKNSDKELSVLERKEKMKALKKEKRALLIKKYKLNNVYVKRGAICAAPFLAVGMFCLIFSILGSNLYRFQSKSFISSCLNKVDDYQSYKANHMIYMDGLDYEGIGQLNDYTLYIENNYNGEYNEHSDIYTLEANTDQFQWERFVKNDLKVIKTPYDPQYIQVEDFKKYGFDYEEDSVLNQSLDNYISKLSMSNFKSIQKKQNKVIGELGLSGYLSYYFTPSKNQTFFYTLESQGEKANAFFKDLIKTLSMDASYKSFLKEEQTIQSKLGKNDVFISELDRFVSVMIKDIKAESVAAELTFDQKGNLVSSDITFQLSIKDNDKHFALNIMSNYSNINESFEVEKDIYTINSMKYNEIFPRIEQEAFKESESAPVVENISTLKEIEQNDNVNFNPSSQSPVKEEPKEEEVLIVEVETDIDLGSND